MGYLRTMGAGLAGSTTKLYGNANVNQIQYGDKLQGLPPVTGARRPYGIYRTRAGGGAPGRSRVFCVNQLGGVGNVKNSQFAPNADGVGWCPNKKNERNGNAGIHVTDRPLSGLAHARHDRGGLLGMFGGAWKGYNACPRDVRDQCKGDFCYKMDRGRGQCKCAVNIWDKRILTASPECCCEKPKG